MAKDINDMTAAELRQLQLEVADEMSDEQAKALSDKIIEVMVAEGVAAGLAKAEAKTALKTFDKKAYSRYPALKDKDSLFYKQVNEALESRGDGETNPTALLDAANEVALALGMGGSTWVAKSADNPIKGAGDASADEEPTGKKYTEAHKDMLDQLVADGFIDPKDEAAMGRINEKGEALNG